MAESKSGFTILRWNGEYAGKCQFVVKDNKTNKQSLFTPGRTNDLAWVETNLADSNDYGKWDDFQHEKVDSLEDVVM